MALKNDRSKEDIKLEIEDILTQMKELPQSAQLATLTRAVKIVGEYYKISLKVKEKGPDDILFEDIQIKLASPQIIGNLHYYLPKPEGILA